MHEPCFQNWGFKQEQVPQLSKDTLFIFYGKLNTEHKTYALPVFRATFSKVMQLVFHVTLKINGYMKKTLAHSIPNHPINS